MRGPLVLETYIQPSRPRTRRRSSPREPLDATLAELSKQQQRVALALWRGETNGVAAEALGITEGTFKVYTSHLFDRLGITAEGNQRVRVALWVERQMQAQRCEQCQSTPYCDSGSGI